MKKVFKYGGLVLVIFIVGGIGGVLAEYIIFTKVTTNPVWSQNPFIKSFDNRVEVIKTTEKVIIEDNESIADIASRAATTAVYVESVSPEGVKIGGNGVIVGSDGIIATASTLVSSEGGTTYVKLGDNRVLTAESVYVDVYAGIAFLTIDAQDLATIPFANSDDARSGKRIISIMQSRVDNGVYFASGGLIGNAYAFSTDVPTSDHLQGVLKIDFSEDVLNSSVGAPVVDYRGNMIGLIAQKNDVNDDESPKYYALAANDVYHSFELFLQSKTQEASTRENLLGVNYNIISDVDVHADELGVDSGALIAVPVTYQERVAFGSTLAGRSGLQGGDVVVGVNNDVVDAQNNLSRLMHKNVGQEVSLKVLRGTDLLTITLLEQ